MAAIVAGLLFLFTELVVLKAADPFRRSLYLFPLYTFITVWVVTYFVIQKGVNGWMKSRTYTDSCPPAGSAPEANYVTGSDGTVKVTGCTISNGTNAWISAVCAAVVTVICIACLKLVVKAVNRDLAAIEAAEESEANGAQAEIDGAVEAPKVRMNKITLPSTPK